MRACCNAHKISFFKATSAAVELCIYIFLHPPAQADKILPAIFHYLFKLPEKRRREGRIEQMIEEGPKNVPVKRANFSANINK